MSWLAEAVGRVRLDRRRRKILCAVTLACLAFAAGLFPARSAYLWDEGAYLAMGETLLSAEPYFTEIDYRPPLLPVLLHFGSYIIPLDLLGRLLSAAFLVLGAEAILLLGYRLYGEWEGVIAAALMLASPYFLWWSGTVLSDIPAAALVAASLYFLFESIESTSGRMRSALLSGALLAAAFLTRWTSVLAGVVALSLWLLRRLQLRLAFTLAAGFLSLAAPYALWAYLWFGNILTPFRLAKRAIEGNVPISDPFFYLRAFLILAGPIALLGLLLYASDLARNDWKRRLATDLPLLLCVVVFPAYLSTLEFKTPRYLLAAIPPLFLFAGKGFGRRLKHGGTVERLVVAALVGLGVWWSVADLDFFRAKTQGYDYRLACSADTRSAADFLRSTLPAGQVLYSNHIWPVLAYYSKLRTLRLWPHDERFFGYFPHNMPESGLLVHYSGVGKEPTREWLDSRAEFRRVEQFGCVTIYSYEAPRNTIAIGKISATIGEARLAYRERDFERALDILTPIGDRLPRVACVRGWSLYKLGQVDEAARVFESGLESDSRDSCSLTGRAYCRLRNGDAEEAERLFSIALENEPDSVDALIGLGLSYLRQDRNVDAARQFRRVLELSPDNLEVREHLRRAEASTG